MIVANLPALQVVDPPDGGAGLRPAAPGRARPGLLAGAGHLDRVRDLAALLFAGPRPHGTDLLRARRLGRRPGASSTGSTRSSAFVLVIVAGIGAVVMPFARISVERELPRERIYLFYVMFLL